MDRPDIVLVHGAWEDGSAWGGVIERLQGCGYHVTAPQFPMTSLAANVERLREVLDLQDGLAVVAGHSYGGQIITALGADTLNAAALVYVAAFATDEGESLGALLSGGPHLPGTAHLYTDKQGFGWIPVDDFVTYCASDVDSARARVLHAVQQPLSSSSYTDVMGAPAWKSLPTWYLVATEDQVIPAEAQRHFASRMGAATVEVRSSHLVQVSHPDEVTALIMSAAESCAPTA